MSLVIIGVPFKGGIIHFNGYGPLKMVKISIWLLTKVFVWICKIVMGRKRKLKKVCCDRKILESNVVSPKLTIEKQNVVAP